ESGSQGQGGRGRRPRTEGATQGTALRAHRRGAGVPRPRATYRERFHLTGGVQIRHVRRLSGTRFCLMLPQFAPPTAGPPVGSVLECPQRRPRSAKVVRDGGSSVRIYITHCAATKD